MTASPKELPEPMPIENRTQLRILKTLTEYQPGLNLAQLQKRISTTHKVLTRNIEQLKQKGLLTEHKYGRIRIIELNKENLKTQLIIKLFQEEK
jgi:DNA-binding MarR family transcriptional regulator